jgi:GDPmannose 4,6-dehydratase
MGVARIKCGLAESLQLGNLDAVRDWGYAADYVRAMSKMLQMPTADDYVLATGESHSVREFCDVAFNHVGLNYRDFVRVDSRAQRPPERVPLVGDAAKARRVLEWKPSVTFAELVRMMVDADVARLVSERVLAQQ